MAPNSQPTWRIFSAEEVAVNAKRCGSTACAVEESGKEIHLLACAERIHLKRRVFCTDCIDKHHGGWYELLAALDEPLAADRLRLLESKCSTRGGGGGSGGASRKRKAGDLEPSDEDEEIPKPSLSRFDIDDFIAPQVAHFLGICSLVRFGSIAKSHRKILSDEVARRKEAVAAIEAEVTKLLGNTYSGKAEHIPLRADVLKAIALADQAKRWIDDEVNLHDRIFNPAHEWFSIESDRLFANERKKFVCESFEPLGSLHILPLCFYVPPEGESGHPSNEEIELADRKAGWIWGAEDHMGGVYNCCWDLVEYDYEDPFRKFEHSLADSFIGECVCPTAYALARGGHGGIDAFRVAARQIVASRPGSRDCLWYTIVRADEERTQH